MEDLNALVMVFSVLFPMLITAEETKTLDGHNDAIYATKFSPNGKTLATSSKDGSIRLWDITKLNNSKVLSGHKGAVYALAFSLDGKLLASGGEDGKVYVWNLGNKKVEKVFQEHSSAAIWSLAFAPDGNRLASGSKDRKVRIWGIENGNLETTIIGDDCGVRALAFSPNGKILANGGGDKTVGLWDLDQRRFIMGFTNATHCPAVTALEFSPDGMTLAVAGSSPDTISFFDVKKKVFIESLRGETGFSSLAFSANGKNLVSGDYANNLIIWDVATKKKRATLKDHSSSVLAVALSPTQDLLASGSVDGVVKLRNIKTLITSGTSQAKATTDPPAAKDSP